MKRFKHASLLSDGYRGHFLWG